MTYTAEKLVSRFIKVGNARKMNKKFSNDAGYWSGGKCNWGGSHNLQEDCEAMANAFNKIDSLGNIKKELLDTTSKQEFDAKKQNFLRKVEETETGLKLETGTNNSIFGVCCIWNDKISNRHVERIVSETRKELDKIKTSLEKESYKWAEEIKQLDLEIGKIEADIKKLRKEVLDEKDPMRRGKIMQEIEDQGKVLQEKYQKKQELSSKFNFNPGAKVKSLIDAIKKALDKEDRKNSGGSSGAGDSRRKNNPDPSDPDNSESDDNNPSNRNNNNNEDNNENQSQPSFFQENKLFIFAGIGLLAFVYLYSNQNEYDD